MARPGFVAYLFVVQCTTAVLCRCFYIRFVLPLINLKRGEQGKGKFFLRVFLHELRGQTLQRGLKYTPFARFVLCFLEIDEGVGQPLAINLIHSSLKDYALMEMHSTLDYG